MDNKQDRQFYWEVKNFLNKNSEPMAPKPSQGNLNSAAKTIMEQNNQYKQSTFKPNIDNDTSINNLVNYIAATHKKAEPSSIAHQKTAHINPFGMISESIFGQAASAAKKLSSAAMASANPSLNINARNAQSNAQAQMPGPIGIPSASSSTGSPSTPGAPPMVIGGVPGGPGGPALPASVTSSTASGASPSDASDADLIDNLRSARGMPKGDRGGIGNKGRGESERAANRADRAARNEALKTAGIAATRRREENRDEEKRTREEAKEAQKALDAAQKAKEATRREEAGPTPDGSPAVSYGAQESKAYDEAQRSYQDAQKAAKEAKEKARTFNERSGYNQPSPQFGNSTPADIALRYKAKAEENALPFDDRPISPFYRMTRNQFRAATGRDFDASGGSVEANMRTLVNNQTNLAGRLRENDAIQQANAIHAAQMKAMDENMDLFRRAQRGDAAAADEFLRIMNDAKEKAKRENPRRNWTVSDFDVPPTQNPIDNRDPYPNNALRTNVYDPAYKENTGTTNQGNSPRRATNRREREGLNP
jgi:hypothetical protein